MKKVLLAGFGLMTAASAAMGEEVQATKKAAILTPIENLYGRVELRQTSQEWSAEDRSVQRSVASYQLRPRVGTKMFNNRLDTFAEVAFTNSARTSNFKQGQGYWYAEFAALQGDTFNITPYQESFLPYEGKAFETKLAVTLDAKTAGLNLGVGELTLHGGLEPQMGIGTREKTTSNVNRNREKLTLSEGAAAPEVKQQEPDFTLEYIGGIAFKPSFAPKFNLTADVYFDRNYKPVYDEVVDAEGQRLEKAGYAHEDKTLTDVILDYKADSLTTIRSRTMINHDGLFASANKPQSEPRIQQRLSLIHKLF